MKRKILLKNPNASIQHERIFREQKYNAQSQDEMRTTEQTYG
jgi:hypothetical protein